MTGVSRDEADRVRVLLRDLLRSVQIFNEFEPVPGQRVSASYATALILLLRGECDAPEGLGPSLRELGEGLAIDKSNVTRLCQRMEALGHVSLAPCPRDGRVKRVHLTPEGEALALAVDDLTISRFRMALRRIPDSERGRVLEGFGRLVQAVLDTSGEAAEQYLKDRPGMVLDTFGETD